MFAQLATDKLLRSLDRLEYGSLQLVTPDGRMRQFEGKKPGVSAWLRFHDWRVPVNLAAKGDVGFAHDYQEGKWETNNLENLLSLGMMNDHAMGQYVFGSRVFEYVANLSYKLRMNTLQGSRKNIHAHYDLGNDFYKLWLDPTMTYSSALYHHDGESLEQAQNNKYDRMIDRLGNASGNILEVGCGWGGFADRCLQRGDYDLKGITLSSEQKLYADQRLNGKANIALEDYRTQTGKFDNIVSIEMFEAVGEEYWPTYFNKIFSLLRPGGTMVFDHTSRANYALAAREGALDHSTFGYDPRVQGGDKTVFYAAASVDELQLAADSAGLDLIDVAPLGFFRQNAVIAAVLGGEGFQAYRKAVDAFYQDPGARAFIQWFEQNITRALPLDMVNGMGVVLRKRAAA